jgi:hypothetical protein
MVGEPYGMKNFGSGKKAFGLSTQNQTTTRHVAQKGK